MPFRMPLAAPPLSSSWRSSQRSLPLDRRRFLRGAGASLVVAPALASGAFAQGRWRADPFALGVASGAPRPDGFVLWTRVAPDPLSSDPAMPGGMTGGDVPVTYEIASDPQMRDVVRRGAATAEAAYAHSVHADIRGLPPGRSWWYRFLSGDAASPVGRAMTTVPAGTPLPRLRFGFVSCANYEFGYFSAYRHLADENPDVVLYLGDYFYEYIEQVRPTVRTHSDGIEAATLPTYRNRYAQYRLDPDLARLHAIAPTLVTWDDHEVSNDYAGKYSQFFDEPELFLRRRESLPGVLRAHAGAPDPVAAGRTGDAYLRPLHLRRPTRGLDDRRPPVPLARRLLRAAQQAARPSRDGRHLSGAPR
jgi:alkaline phosphatase D